MIYVALPDELRDQVRPLPFYLAMEEHLARNYPRQQEYFFMWQVEPTVIFGRCQNPFAEVNLDYCRREGIATYRRKSGGGCVYADMDNVMLSYVGPCRDAVTVTFSDYCSRVASMLRSLGVDARATGRNDITIDGRKVSGNAFYHLHDRAILHGTMLLDADPGRMVRAISPSDAKLRAKGVESVRSHITTLRHYLPELTAGQLLDHCRRWLCDDTLILTDADLEEVEAISRQYYTDSWLWGRFGRGETATGRRRIEGVGEFAPVVELLPPTSPGSLPRIGKVNLQGDFFLLADLDSTLLDRLRGVELSYKAVMETLRGVDVASVIAGLQPCQLAGLLTGEPSET